MGLKINTKKGISFRAIGLEIHRIMFVLLAFLIVVFMVRFFISDRTDITAEKANIFMHQMMYSDVIMYQDNLTKRIYSGEVDLQKFNSTILNERIYYAPELKILTARLILEFDGKKQEIFYDQDLWNKWRPLANTFIQNAPKKFTKTYPVIVWDNLNSTNIIRKNGMLTFEVLTKED